LRFWYPAAGSQKCQQAPYTSAAIWNYFAQLERTPLPEIKTNSCWNAPMANGLHPVVVFTHGYTGTFTDYTFLFEDLASRGYIVASVDHTYEATAVQFPDGRMMKSVFGSHLGHNLRSDTQAMTSAVSIRLGDLKFVVDELEHLNSRADSPFRGRLDISRLALAGHSLGGLTAFLGVEREPRFKAGIILNGSVPNALVNPTRTPLLILTSGNEAWSENECHLWSHLLGPRLAINLRGAEHITATDAVWIANSAVKTGTMGTDKTVAAVRSYIAAFLDANLRGKRPGRLLAGPSLDYPDADVTAQSQSLCRTADPR
jgi:dienelactone hydrolase